MRRSGGALLGRVGQSWRGGRGVALTTERRPELVRGDYARLGDSDVAAFEAIVGPNRVLTQDLDAFNTDWLNTCRGQSSCVVKPGSAEEVAAVLRHCSGRRLAVVPQGGNTGLVGGSVPVFDEVVLSLANLTTVHELDPVSGILVADAGCILENLDNLAAEHGLGMPLDLGAKGSCHIGGNVATGAGGIRLLRYGSLHAHLLGLQAVTGEGEVLDSLKPLRKDNTGLHLPHLFVGSEGQLGVITKVGLTLVPRPLAQNLAFLALKDFASCKALLSLAKRKLGEILSSFEFLDREAMRCAEGNLKLKNPLPEAAEDAEFYVLVETSGSHEAHDQEKLNLFLEEALGSGVVADGTVAADGAQFAYIWSLRERLAEALVHDGFTYKQDFSLRLEDFYSLVELTRERLAGSGASRVVGYGHLGDGNLHLNVTSPAFDPEIAKLLYPWLYEWVASRGGSISAEHGLGLEKAKYAHLMQSDAALGAMRRLKNVFDPQGILNPYKTILPQ